MSLARMNAKKPLLMAILNLTPDSFSDGGKYNALDQALKRCEHLLSEGADIIDLGGESTRPGAQAVSEQEEIDRVLPVIEAVQSRMPCTLSVDTSSEALMREALGCGVSMINDVRALQRVSNFDFLAKSDCSICLMHMQGEPDMMQQAPVYQDVIDEVSAFLRQRIRYCEQKGIESGRIVIDPGFGFGKSLQHNLRLLNNLEGLEKIGCPVLVGISRKSMIGKVLDKKVEDRLYGSIAAMVIALNKGVHIVRVHDVAASKDALDLTWASLNEGKLNGDT